MANFSFGSDGFESTSTSKRQPGIANKLFISIVCTLFLAFGVGLSFVILRDDIHTLAMRSWPTAPCTILASKVDEKSPYTCDLTYSYQAGGKHLTATQLYPGYNGSTDYYDAEKLHLRYPKGTATTCVFNPANPTEASLQLPSLWRLLQILFPLLFAFIGGGLMYLIWRPRRPHSPQVVQLKHPLILTGCVFSSFLMVGLVLLAVYIPKELRATAAQQWPQANCVITQSGVRSIVNHDKHGSHTTYAVQVVFHYTFNGQRYGSGRYDLINSSTSDYASQQRIVDLLPRGKRTICYVNPLDPADAVINRTLGWGRALLIGLPSIFILVGCGGLLFVVRTAHSRHRADMEDRLGASTRSPAELKPLSSPIAQLAGSLAFLIVWDGVVAILWSIGFSQWQAGHLSGDLIFIGTVFTIAGLVVTLSTIKRARDILLGVRVHVGIDRHPAQFDEDAQLHWRISGPYDRLTRLTISLRAFQISENDIFLKGMRTAQPYWTGQLFESVSPAEIQSGRCALRISSGVLEAEPGRRTIWTIAVATQFGRRKPVTLQFPIRVVPALHGAQLGAPNP